MEQMVAERQQSQTLFTNQAMLGFQNVNWEWQNDIELKSLVYNKEFRDRNFGKGTIAGVFTLGQATTEEAKIIEENT